MKPDYKVLFAILMVVSLSIVLGFLIGFLAVSQEISDACKAPGHVTVLVYRIECHIAGVAP